MNSKAIAEILRNLRGNKTLDQVSKETGLTVSALSNYENGIRIPRDEIKIQIANYYHKSVEEIFFSQ